MVLLYKMLEMLQCSPWGCMYASVLLGCALEGTWSPVDVRVATAIGHSGSRLGSALVLSWSWSSPVKLLWLQLLFLGCVR